MNARQKSKYVLKINVCCFSLINMRWIDDNRNEKRVDNFYKSWNLNNLCDKI